MHENAEHSLTLRLQRGAKQLSVVLSNSFPRGGTSYQVPRQTGQELLYPKREAAKECLSQIIYYQKPSLL